MALLTNPSANDVKLARLLNNNGKIICFTIYFAGIAWFLALAHRSFNYGTYFSENALLPGLVRGEFDEDVTAKQLHSELLDVMRSSPNSIPFDWLLKKFHEMSIDAYLHNFTLDYPFLQNTTYQGQNVYGILRAPRSSSIEGLIVTAPFRTLASAHPDNSASIALMLALAKFCRKHKYWAKDIVFLITDHEQLGTQAWLEAYHNIQLGSGVLKYGNIVGRAGSIQAAINLEMHSTKISHIDVKIEGLNGQLPNLDLVNLVHKLCKNEGIRHTFKNRGNPRKRESGFQQWYYSFSTLISMVFTQASCVPNGNHGLYHRFGIEAVTLEGYEPSDNYKKQVSGLYQTGRVLEGILRSLNNLLERFHQSYFFYLLPSTDRFIPIGSYMPSVCMVIGSLLIEGFIIWLRIYSKFKPRGGKEEITEDKKQEDSETSGLKFTAIGLLFLLAHGSGWLLTLSGTWLAKTGFYVAAFPPKLSIYAGALLELATLLLIIAMHNFSLSLILSIIYVPCVSFIVSKSGRFLKLIRIVYMLLLHPFVLIHLIVVGYTFFSHGAENLIFQAFKATQHSFVYLIIDDMMYGNWFLKAIFGFLLPNWILFWTCLHS